MLSDGRLQMEDCSIREETAKQFREEKLKKCYRNMNERLTTCPSTPE